MSVGDGEEQKSSSSQAGGGGKVGAPAEFIYDNGQILLGLLRGRTEEEAKRRFVTGLRRGPDDAPAPEDP